MRTPIARCSVARIYNCEAREEPGRTASAGSGAHPGKSGIRALAVTECDPLPRPDRRRRGQAGPTGPSNASTESERSGNAVGTR
jgi:hypothetical protein